MRVLTIMLTLLIAVAFVGNAFASNNMLEFAGGSQGKVTFDGKMHNQKLGAGKCMECHKNNQPFPMKKPGAEGAAKIAAPHKAGEFCGTCHD
ncbi:MAG: hypothetical protein AAB017_07810, partial [Nitrospirota bacterium]